MLRWCLDVRCPGCITISLAMTVIAVIDKLREKWLGWFEYFVRKDKCHTTRQAMRLVVEGTRPRAERWLGNQSWAKRVIRKATLNRRKGLRKWNTQ